MQQQVYHSPIYDTESIQAWEQRWFAQQNSAYGLMQQAAWSIAQHLMLLLEQQRLRQVAVCCGQGNNAGDGYLLAKYLQQYGYSVTIYAAPLGQSESLQHAYQAARDQGIEIIQGFDFKKSYQVYVDALFGIGLNRPLGESWQNVIDHMNQQMGLKIALDLPSGLHANTGQPLPVAIQADYTFSILGLKAGLYTGQAKQFSGKIELISLIPIDAELKPLAHLSSRHIDLPKREAFGHKGSYGHVLVVGGHADMGGAVIMAGEAAFSAGAGKVTIVCDAKHHNAILSRSPNIMLRDINTLDLAEIDALVKHVDAVCLGMGLGRDAWAQLHYQTWFSALQKSTAHVVMDADALWFLAEQPQPLPQQCYLTPHPGEAATLLGCKTVETEADRIAAIQQLQKKYGGEWVLKGAGSLTLQNALFICSAGNAGMGTGGMGDVLAGMIASLKAQFDHVIQLHEIVMLHAQAGDLLAKSGERGLQAQEMKHAIYQVVNPTEQ